MPPVLHASWQVLCDSLSSWAIYVCNNDLSAFLCKFVANCCTDACSSAGYDGHSPSKAL